jgi:hypothetical protein
LNLFPYFRVVGFRERRARSSILAGDRTSDPLIKSQIQSGPERALTRKPNYFEARLGFSSAMRDACSAQIQAQNKHSQINSRLKESALALPAAFADTNIVERQVLMLKKLGTRRVNLT